MATGLFVLLAILAFAPQTPASERVTIDAANLSIELIDGMMEVEDPTGQDGENRHALLMEPDRNFVFRLEEKKKKPYAETLKFVRESYAPEAGLAIAESEEIFINGKMASILVSGPDKSKPQMRQSILVLGDTKNSVFAYVVYPAADKEAAADVKKMFLSVVWPLKR